MIYCAIILSILFLLTYKAFYPTYDREFYRTISAF